MSDKPKNETVKETDKTDEALSDSDLDQVSGGINPQPVPPHRPVNLD